jgi:hypothetical protein
LSLVCWQIIDDVETVSPQYFIDREIDPKTFVVLILTGMVRTVAPETFKDCEGLKTVTADTVETVGNRAFKGCSGITTLSLPSVQSIGNRAFFWCTGITSLSLPMVQSIGGDAFWSCEGITSLSLPMVQSIGGDAFWSCKGITSLSLPSTVQSIGDNAFRGCIGITTLSLPMVQSIGKSGFEDCRGITSLDLPSVQSIGTHAFNHCIGITTLSLPSVQSIGCGAVDHCIGITTLSLPMVQSIGNIAFLGCKGITTLSLPMVQSIGDSAFAYCEGITSLSLPMVQSIGDRAFKKCKGIKSVTVPAGCKMGKDAFPAGCKVVTAGSTVSDADAASTGNDQGPDADWVADQSADASAPGKRKATGIKKKAKKRKGGYTDKGRLAFKSEGGVLATGHARTCIPDALFVLLSTLLTTPPDLETVRTAIMGGDLYKDALFTTAQAYIESLGRLSPTSPPLHRLPCVTKDFLLKGGPAYHLLNTTGRLFLVHLLVSYGPDDKEPDDHCVAYDGLTVRDNGQYKKVKELDDGDRSSPEKARDVFDSLYKGMMVRIKNVYELL